MGITEYTSPECAGFVGILKQRYSDFVVREISADGEVLYLTDLDGSELQKSLFGAEQTSSIALSPEEAIEGTISQLKQAYSREIDEETVSNLRNFLSDCHNKVKDGQSTWMGLPCEDKTVRGALHKAVRVHSADFVESTTETIENIWYIKLHSKHAMNVQQSQGGRGDGGKGAPNRRKQFSAWPENVGDYIRFVLLKENVDTMTAASLLAKQLHVKPNNICYNGTKDKRGITTQHVTLFRKKPADFTRINRYFGNPFMRVGNFQYVKEPARLGNLSGNRFEIILRDVQGTEADVVAACDALRSRGFINYYGLQRFGKGYAGASHHIGRAVLRSDWKECIDVMFAAPPADSAGAAFNASSMNEVRAQYALGNFQVAANILPQSMFREKAILQRLAQSPLDFMNAFHTMGKNLRLMCVHAYQSALWNRSVSQRLRKFGFQVVVGDLVRILRTEKETPAHSTVLAMAEGEDVEQDEEDVAASMTESNYSIHIVTEDDVNQQRFGLHDVVLPLLGTETIMPGHEIAAYMVELLREDGMSLETFSTCNVAYRLKGNYRTILQQPQDFQYELIRYAQHDEELAVTELQKFRESRDNKNNKRHVDIAKGEAESTNATNEPAQKKLRVDEEGQAIASNSEHLSVDTAAPASKPYLALQLKFGLQSGCYATMLLREVMKQSTESSHHAGLTSMNK